MKALQLSSFGHQPTSSSSPRPTRRILAVEATYALADYREAIVHAARSDRTGKVLFALGASED